VKTVYNTVAQQMQQKAVQKQASLRQTSNSINYKMYKNCTILQQHQIYQALLSLNTFLSITQYLLTNLIPALVNSDYKITQMIKLEQIC